MSYQPPGPYPGYPQYPGGAVMPPTKPPIPQTVQRAFVLMLVGAGLEVVNVVLSFLFNSQAQQKIQDALNAGTTTSTTSINLASTAFGGIIGIGLWIWMAFANRGGANWARITATVFFGISCLGLLGDIAVVALLNKWIGGTAYLLGGLGMVAWVNGLFVLILLWKKESGAYFKPQQYLPYPTPPYPYPVMPGQPMQPMQPQDGAQQPGDPWATPPGH